MRGGAAGPSWRTRRVAALAAILATFSALLAPAASAGSPFADVDPEAYYAEAVEWLVDQKITTGTTDTTYEPESFVTRGQMAAFLARFGNNTGGNDASVFSDVPDGTFYTDPVGWLLSHGITTGTSATTYSPGDFVTRGQMAAFLWRLGGRLPSTGFTPFTDVDPAAYYGEAVSWLLDRGITKGTTATTYSPDSFVTRGQMAAFLFRLAGEPKVGTAGVMRAAATALPASGGIVAEGDISIVIGSLAGPASVRVEGIDPKTLPAQLHNPSGGPVELTISGASLTGAATITIPVGADAGALGSIASAYAMGPSGTWSLLGAPVSITQVEGQWYATFDLAAATPFATSSLHSSGLRSFAGGSAFARYVVQVSVEPPFSGPLDITTGDADDALPRAQVDVPYEARIWARGGTLPYFTLNVPEDHLPAGLTVTYQVINDVLTAVISGTPTEIGTTSFIVSVVDADGVIANALLYLWVDVPPEPIPSTRILGPGGGAYPSVSPSGSHAAWRGSTGTTIYDHAEGTVDEYSGAAGRESEMGGVEFSADGRYVAYATPDGLFQRDLVAETLTLIATGTGLPRMSHDGRFVYFAAGRGPDVDEDGYDFFLWDRDTDLITRVTNGDEGVVGQDRVHSISDDGRYLVFVSSATDYTAVPDTNAHNDLFLYDRIADSFSRITDDAGGSHGRPWISGDGSVVYFASYSSTLVAGDVAGLSDIFVWERASETMQRVAPSTTAHNGFGFFEPAMSTDGNYLAFQSSATDLTPEIDANGGSDLFLFDLAADSVTRVTNSSSSLPYKSSPAISADGSVVAFLSHAEDITPDDDYNGGKADVFLWYPATDEYRRVTAGSNRVDRRPFLSADGSILYFQRHGLEVADIGP